jgi:hypothetical protein
MNRNVDLPELARFQEKMVLFGVEVQSYSRRIESCVADAESIMKDPPSKKSMEQTRQIAIRLNRAGARLEQEAHELLTRTRREIERFESL